MAFGPICRPIWGLVPQCLGLASVVISIAMHSGGDDFRRVSRGPDVCREECLGREDLVRPLPLPSSAMPEESWICRHLGRLHHVHREHVLVAAALTCAQFKARLVYHFIF